MISMIMSMRVVPIHLIVATAMVVTVNDSVGNTIGGNENRGDVDSNTKSNTNNPMLVIVLVPSLTVLRMMVVAIMIEYVVLQPVPMMVIVLVPSLTVLRTMVVATMIKYVVLQPVPMIVIVPSSIVR